jgi:hypothetical protein
MASFIGKRCEASRVSTSPVPTPPPDWVAGWREWVVLPDIGVDWVKAKLDTGARSSAIHAWDIAEFQRDGAPWVSFEIHPWQRSDLDSVPVELPVVDRRVVRSSTGHEEERLVVETTIRVVEHDLTAELTLTNRDEMGFRMLVGREALRGSLVVDPGRSDLGPRPPLRQRRRNRQVANADGA